MSFLNQFDVILLDLNGTFVFGHDRFGPEQDYFTTYQAQGGTRLDRAAVIAMVERCLTEMLRVYVAPACFDDFPTLEEAFSTFVDADARDLPALCATFAAHEIGRIPPAHATLLRQLSITHRLGVVSNICSNPAMWREHFANMVPAKQLGCGTAWISDVGAGDVDCVIPSLLALDGVAV